ncbi:MAG: TIR domain-containing protein [Hyphomonadaceae bacterium]
MTDVFISYAREDAAQAERIARGLEGQGLSVFWDNEIPPGQTWADYIEGKLNQCNVAVVLWSEHSTKSQWVREEARMGRNKLIPAKLDNHEAPFGFGDVQAADLSGWGGDYNHPQWARFTNAVLAKARPNAPSAAPQPPLQHQPQPQSSGWQAPPGQQQQQGGWQTPPPNQNQQQQGWSNSGQSGGATISASSPIEYIQKCFRLYIDGKGRARRAEYWWWALFSIVLSIVAGIADLAFGINPYTGLPNSQILSMVVGLGLLAPTVSVMSRRLHDAAKSGWIAAGAIALSILGGLLGVLGGLLSLAALIAIGVLPPTVGPNQYGPDPKAP